LDGLEASAASLTPGHVSEAHNENTTVMANRRMDCRSILSIIYWTGSVGKR
jgi:hypothetical protein